MTFRLFLFAVAAVAWTGLAPAADNAAVLARMTKDVHYLAGEECNGRGVGSAGIDKAADYVAAAFKEAGLQPAGPDGSYFQPFSIYGTPKLGTPNKLRLTGPEDQAVELRYAAQFMPTGQSSSGQVTGELVFVGYGISSEKPAYDDYAGLDVAGKFVVVLRRTPRAENKTEPFAPDNSPLATLVSKVDTAVKKKAAGVIFVNDRTYGKDRDELMDYRRTVGGGDIGIPVLHMKRAMLDHMLAAQDKKLADIEDGIDKDLKLRSLVLTGWSAAAQVTVVRPETKAKNVIGVLPGSGPLADETVVIGAHYDHLGTDMYGSLLGAAGQGKVHYGADDNASGTTGLIELARRFAANKDRVGRRIVFIAFSGEERGLLGSIHYCRNPLFPLKDTVFMLNMDMIGRSIKVKDGEVEKDRLVVYGHGTADGLEAMIDTANKKYDFKLFKVPGGNGPSDHNSFYNKNIPVLFFFTGTHRDYHRPTDTPDKINVPAMMKVVDMAEGFAAHFGQATERPKFQQTKGGWEDPTTKAAADPHAGASPGGKMPRLSLMPDYTSDAENNGMRVEAVTDGGPAAKAGLKAGDIVIEFAGSPVKNATQYTRILQQQKPGKEVEIVVMRDGKKVPLKVAPAAPKEQ